MVYRDSNPCACLASMARLSPMYTLVYCAAGVCNAIRRNILSSARQLVRFKTSLVEI
jgi:hypothetical protein